jgi:hypothetical protein
LYALSLFPLIVSLNELILLTAEDEGSSDTHVAKEGGASVVYRNKESGSLVFHQAIGEAIELTKH